MFSLLKKNNFILLLKLFVTIVFLFLLFKKIDINDFLSSLKIIKNYLWLLLTVLLQISSIFLAALRWYFLMNKINIKNNNFIFYLKHYFIGMLISQTLPTSIGGDAYRIVIINKYQNSKLDSFYLILVDRVMGVLGLVFIINISLWLVDLKNDYFITMRLIVTIIMISSFFIIFFLKPFLFLKNNKYLNWLNNLWQYIHIISKDKIFFLSQLILSILVHFLVILCFYSLTYLINIKISLVLLILCVPLSLLFSLLPISIAGWGVREISLLTLISFFISGYDSKIVLISIIYGIVLLLSCSPALLFLFTRDKNK